MAQEGEYTRWKRTFEQYATVERPGAPGERFLDEKTFVDAIAPKEEDAFARITRDQYAILFKCADRQRRGLVSWDDFVVFETLLQKPDADFIVAFQTFDLDDSNNISFSEFKKVFSASLRPSSIPFDFDCNWLKLYLGKKHGTQGVTDDEHVLGYHEFSQMMKGLQGERIRQAFRHFDADNDGYIAPEDFQRIILEIASHKLSDSVLERLPSLCTLTPGQKISYADVRAFYNVLRNMDLVERIVHDATVHAKDGRITPSDFLSTAQRSTRYGVFTPMEAAIIFHFASPAAPVSHASDGTPRLARKDFDQLLDPHWRPTPEMSMAAPKKSALHETLTGIYNFGLGGVAGATGATVVYPIDLVKTRMQNQRSAVVGELLYKNSLDCVRKVYKNEGFKGFYRGLLPQLVGVAPEKAIKLTVNDAVRHFATDPVTGHISLPWEIIAGGAAGGSQVVFTNPLEIVKIRLQIQGEAAKVEGAVPRGAIHIVRQLGLVGLYKGASACLLRDVPFSMVYFTAYSHLKKDVFGEGHNGKKLGFGETLTAAAIAGMPAAYFTTPADVIKTRLQVEARKGQATYKGMMDAFTKILAQEGPKAFFKGGPARVLRSSPQFGVTLVAYEWLHKLLPYPFDPQQAPSVQALLPRQEEDITRVRARQALKILLDTHGDFGKVAVSS